MTTGRDNPPNPGDRVARGPTQPETSDFRWVGSGTTLYYIVLHDDTVLAPDG